MQFKMKPLTMTLWLLGVISSPAWADSQSDATDQNQEKKLEIITERTEALETEVHTLETEIKELKAEKQQTQHKAVRAKPPIVQPVAQTPTATVAVANVQTISLASQHTVAKLGSNQKEFPL